MVWDLLWLKCTFYILEIRKLSQQPFGKFGVRTWVYKAHYFTSSTLLFKLCVLILFTEFINKHFKHWVGAWQGDLWNISPLMGAFGGFYVAEEQKSSKNPKWFSLCFHNVQKKYGCSICECTVLALRVCREKGVRVTCLSYWRRLWLDCTIWRNS